MANIVSIDTGAEGVARLSDRLVLDAALDAPAAACELRLLEGIGNEFENRVRAECQALRSGDSLAVSPLQLEAAAGRVIANLALRYGLAVMPRDPEGAARNAMFEAENALLAVRERHEPFPTSDPVGFTDEQVKS